MAKQISIGDKVYNKHRVGFAHAYSSYSKPIYGIVKSIESGCNTIYWVDFNRGFLTPMIIIDMGREIDWCSYIKGST